MIMKSSSFLVILALTILLAGSQMLSACYSGPNYYGPGFYYGAHPEVFGDYDDQHVWHDRYWWISNHHEWVHEHHPDWVANETPAEHNAYEHHR